MTTFLTEYTEDGQLKGGSIAASSWDEAEAFLAIVKPGAVVVGQKARIEDAPPPIQSAAAILAGSRSDWLYDPDFDGWSVNQ